MTQHDAHDGRDDGRAVRYGIVKSDVDSDADAVSQKILDSAFKIHRMFGPGLLESAYEQCLALDLIKNHGLDVERQKMLSLDFEGTLIEGAYRIDMLVDGKVVVEVKSVDKLLPIYDAQLMTYLRLSSVRTGLILNFGEKLLKNGIRRIVV